MIKNILMKRVKDQSSESGALCHKPVTNNPIIERKGRREIPS